MIRRMVWFCVGLVLGALPVLAFANYEWGDYRYVATYNGAPIQPYRYATTAPGTCELVRAWIQTINTGRTYTVTAATGGGGAANVSCSMTYTTATGGSGTDTKGGGSRNSQQCLAAEEYVCTGGNCECQLKCDAGLERDPLTGQCAAPPCEAGQTGSTSIQVGWSNYWDTNAKPYGVTSPGAGCSGECKVNVTGLAEQSCYLGDSGAGAPYQVLCWYKTETTGEQCTSGEAQLSDRRDPIPCPAGTTQGTIGDKTACVPSTTTETETTTNPDGSTTETTTKTNPDGSTEVTTTEKDASGNVTSSTTKNYPAPGSTGSGSSGGEPGEGGEPQGSEDPLKECVENPDACKEGGGDFGAGAPDGAELFGRDEAKTFAAVLTKFRQDMGQTAFGQAAAGYFDVSGGGSCPVWSSTIPFIDTTITIDYFCDPAVADMLAVMKGALLVVFGFVAFRFAVL